MNYEFPMIKNINDVLPHIEGRNEFIVAERDGYTVINYVVATEDTFGMPAIGEKMVRGAKPFFRYDYGDLIRRECRGLIFDHEGNLMSRPFHKFFNVNEKTETQERYVDVTNRHVIMEKMDGSMIRPLIINGELKLATKMGITDVAANAETWLRNHRNYKNLEEILVENVKSGITPLFEWVSQKNKIVLEYEDDLVYLGSRVNFTGRYFKDSSCATYFTACPEYGSVDTGLGEYIANARTKQYREGDILRFDDGHMVKIKNDWYVRIHKILDAVRTDRNIASFIMNNEIDDIKAKVPVDVYDYIVNYERKLMKCISEKILYIQEKVSEIRGRERKDIALNYMPNIKDKNDIPLLWEMVDNHDPNDLVVDFVKKSTYNNKKWEECVEWLGMKD